MKRLLLGCALLLCGCSASSSQVSIVTKPLQQDAATYSLDLQIPQVTGLHDAEAQQDINAKLQQEVDALVSQFRAQEGAVPPDAMTGMKSGLWLQPHESYLTQKIVSLTVSVSVYSAGAAHPNNLIQGFTYDVAAHKQLSSDDFVKNSASDTPKLIALIRDRLFSQPLNDGRTITKEDVFPGDEGYGDVIMTVTPEGLRASYGPDMIAAHAAGLIETTVSWDDLTSIVSPHLQEIARP